jgi:hypothetical protein
MAVHGDQSGKEQLSRHIHALVGAARAGPDCLNSTVRDHNLVIGQEDHLVIDVRQKPTRGEEQWAALVAEAISSESSHRRQRRLALDFALQQLCLSRLVPDCAALSLEPRIASAVGTASSGLVRNDFYFCHSSSLIVEASSQVDAE